MYTIRHVRRGLSGYSGPRVWLEAKGRGPRSRAQIAGDAPAYMCDHISDISHSGSPYARGNPCVHTQESSQIRMLVSKPPWPSLVVHA